MHAQAFVFHVREPLVLLLVARQAAGDHGVAGLAEPPADGAADAAHAAGHEDDARNDRHLRAPVAIGLAVGVGVGHFQHPQIRREFQLGVPAVAIVVIIPIIPGGRAFGFPLAKKIGEGLGMNE